MGAYFSRTAKTRRRLKVAERTIVELQEKKRELRSQCRARILKIAGGCFVGSVIAGVGLTLFIGISVFSFLVCMIISFIVGTFVFLSLRRLPLANYQRKRDQIAERIEKLRAQCDSLREERRRMQQTRTKIMEIVDELQFVDSTAPQSANSFCFALVCSRCKTLNGYSRLASICPEFVCKECNAVNGAVPSCPIVDS